MILAYGFHDRQSQTIALRFVRRTIKTIEYQIFIQRCFIGCIRNRQAVCFYGYNDCPIRLIVSHGIYNEVIQHDFQQGTIGFYRQGFYLKIFLQGQSLRKAVKIR